ALRRAQTPPPRLDRTNAHLTETQRPGTEYNTGNVPSTAKRERVWVRVCGRTLSRPPPRLHDARRADHRRLVTPEPVELVHDLLDLGPRGEAGLQHRIGDRLHGDGTDQLLLAAHRRRLHDVQLRRPDPRLLQQARQARPDVGIGAARLRRAAIERDIGIE